MGQHINGGALSHGSRNYPLRGGKNTYFDGNQRVHAFDMSQYPCARFLTMFFLLFFLHDVFVFFFFFLNYFICASPHSSVGGGHIIYHVDQQRQVEWEIVIGVLNLNHDGGDNIYMYTNTSGSVIKGLYDSDIDISDSVTLLYQIDVST